MFEAVYMTHGGQKAIHDAYAPTVRENLAKALRFAPPVYTPSQLSQQRDTLAGVSCLFSTWGMFALTAQEIATYLPNLKAVFYAAGSVQGFATPFLKRGVRVFCAASANAVPVAEYVSALILLANKGFLRAARVADGKWQAAQALVGSYPGNYGCRVGLLGAGAIGRLVIQRLHNSDLELLVFDPFLPEEKAAQLGVRKCSLETVFSTCQTISNHLANNAQTRGMLNYDLFSRMKPNATFLNTGRGAQVVEADLLRALREEPGRTALLDVCDPEPPLPGSPLYTLPNLILTPHMAGSLSQEIARMGLYMQRAYTAYSTGKDSPFEVTLPMLQTMA